MKRILIVEDDTEFMNVIKLIIETAGYRTINATNGRVGYEKAATEKPDLIISDILMPIMDGFTFYKKLKNNPQTQNIPVLILTARGQMEDAFRAVGVDEFLEKPTDSQDLLDRIRILLHASHSKSGNKKIVVGGPYMEVTTAIVSKLAQSRYQTEIVRSGPEVISQCVLWHPHMVIMDVQMDGMQASDNVIKAIRILPEFRRMPILVYSYYKVEDLGGEDFQQRALSVDTSQKLCLQAGATEYIGRFNEQSIKDIVRQHFSSSPKA